MAFAGDLAMVFLPTYLTCPFKVQIDTGAFFSPPPRNGQKTSWRSGTGYGPRSHNLRLSGLVRAQKAAMCRGSERLLGIGAPLPRINWADLSGGIIA